MTHTQNRLESYFRHVYDANIGVVLNGSNPKLNSLRADAIQHFEAAGLPTRKTEAWKYTRIEQALRSDIPIAFDAPADTLSDEAIAANLVPDLDAYLIVTLNGRLIAARSAVTDLPAGVTLAPLADAVAQHADLVGDHLGRYAGTEGAPFAALNTAFLKDGLFLHVAQNVRVDKPLQILHLVSGSDEALIQPRMLYIAEQGAEVKLVERWKRIDGGSAFVNSMVEWAVAAQAHADHYQIQELGDSDTLVAGVEGYQSGASTFSLTTITLSGGMIRNNFNLLPDAEDCESHLLGLVLGKGKMHVDNHTLVDHAKPNCFSNELYKHILDDESTCVFNGKVFVRPDAQKINAYQSNKTIVLTEKAQIFAKPELEIYADDVRCSHGATTGQLDAEALFYLRSRGLREAQAKSMLLLAFARDVIEPIKIEALQTYLDGRIADII